MTVTDVSHQQIVKSLTKLPNVFEAEVAGLKLGSRYEAKVALVTSKGDGTFSNSSTVVTYNGVLHCVQACVCVPVCACTCKYVCMYMCV